MATQIELKVPGSNYEEQRRYLEIICALLDSGGMTGVKGGQTILHFDSEGNFVGVQLSYWPWKKRKVV